MTDRPQARGICDASGFEYPLRDLVRQWDGAMVHPRFCDKRNPQDFVRSVRESVLPFTRPEGPDVFVEPGDISPEDL